MSLLLSAWTFSNFGKQGLLFAAVGGLLTAVASLLAEHRLLGMRASAVAALGL